MDYHTPSEIAIGQGRGVEMFSPVRIVVKNPMEQAILAKAYKTILYRKIRYLADKKHKKNKKQYDGKITLGIERAKRLMAGNYCLIKKPSSSIARDKFGLSTLKVKRNLFGPALILSKSKLGKCLLLDLISGYTFERHLNLLAPYRVPCWSPDLQYLWSGIYNTNSNLFKHILEYNLD